MKNYSRLIKNLLLKTISTRPILYLNGSRQVGKSTIARSIGLDNNYITFDSPLILESAKNTPQDFVESLSNKKDLVILDEIQMVPEIFRLLKIAIDESRIANKTQKNGQFLLTGSANLMALPTLSDALVGRMSILTLYPFSSQEYLKINRNFIDDFFNKDLQIEKVKEVDLIKIIKKSTYPELAINDEIDEIQWFNDYLMTIIQRDIKIISDIQKPEKIITLLSILSTRTGGLVNDSAIANNAGLDSKTYIKYKAAIINSFLAFEVRPWSNRNLNKRFIKSPKLYFTDSNMLLYIMRRDINDLIKNDRMQFGHILENFVATQILKQLSIMPDSNFYHFRTSAGKEVDFVIEKNDGSLIGIEVKSSKTINKKDISGLLELQSIAGKDFKKGIILYLGNDILPIQNNIWAVPISHFVV